MKKKSAVRFFLICLFCAISFLSACKAESNVGPAPEKKFTVTYETEYGTLPEELSEGITVKKDSVLNEEQLPLLTDENAVFKGWYDEETKAVPGEYKVTKDVVLVALWADEATVSYSSIFGTVPESFDTKLNSTLSDEKLTGLSVDSYIFEGWFYSKDEKNNGTGTQVTTQDKIKTDITLYAKWRTASISFESLFGQASPITKFSGETITSDEVPVLEQTGYSFEGWAKSQQAAQAEYTNNTSFKMPEQDTTLYAIWKPNEYTITFNANGGTGEAYTQTVTFGKTETLKANSFENKGYDFTGWNTKADGTGDSYSDKEEFAVTQAQNFTLYAKWSPRNDTVYTVEHYQENADNDEFSLFVTETKKGTTNSNTAAEANEYEHFTAQAFNQTTIAPAGDTVVKIYYKRETITMTFNLAGGKIGQNSSVTKKGKYGSSFDVETPEKTGWKFEKWNPSLPQKMETGVYTAVYKAATDTPYTVVHYLQNANDNEYTEKESEIKKGTTEQNTSVVAKDYEHFSPKAFEQKKIEADGSTIICIYYDRETIEFTLDLDGGTLNGETGPITISGKYEQTVPAKTNPEKAGYNFEGWNSVGGKIAAIFAETRTFKAQWSAANGITITVNEADISVEKTQEGNKITFTAASGFDSYAWSLDDISCGSGQSCIIDTKTLTKGTYSFVLEAKKGSNWYSYFAQIKVE